MQVLFLDNHVSFSPNISWPNTLRHSSFFLHFFQVYSLFRKTVQHFLLLRQKENFSLAFSFLLDACPSISNPIYEKREIAVGHKKGGRNVWHLRWHVRHVTSLRASHVRATEARRATPTRAASADFRITGWQLVGCCRESYAAWELRRLHIDRHCAVAPAPESGPQRGPRCRRSWSSAKWETRAVGDLLPPSLLRGSLKRGERKNPEGKYIEERDDRIHTTFVLRDLDLLRLSLCFLRD